MIRKKQAHVYFSIMEQIFSDMDKNLTDMHTNAIRGIRLYNQKHFFEAHEELEIAWRAEKRYVKELYRGILQVGVAYYHISKGNFLGAKKMFERSFKWLVLYPDIYFGVKVKEFIRDATYAYETLIRLGPERIRSFPTGLFKSLPTTDPME